MPDLALEFSSFLTSFLQFSLSEKRFPSISLYLNLNLYQAQSKCVFRWEAFPDFSHTEFLFDSFNPLFSAPVIKIYYVSESPKQVAGKLQILPNSTGGFPFLHILQHSLFVNLLMMTKRHYFANKSSSSQGYGFSCGHVWM